MCAFGRVEIYHCDMVMRNRFLATVDDVAQTVRSERAVARLTQAQLAEDGNASEVLTEAVERELYGQAIRLANGDQTKAARWLGVSRPTMREKLTRYNLVPTRTGDTSLITKASVTKSSVRRETTAGEVEA